MEPTTNQKEKALGHPLFQGAASALLDDCNFLLYRKGEKILHADTEREGLLLLLEGAAEVGVEAADGMEVLELVDSGEMIGFSSLAAFLGEPEPETHTVTVEVAAAEDAVCLSIPYPVMDELWKKEQVREYMMRQVAVRLREIYASLAEQIHLARSWGESDAFIRRAQDFMNEPPAVIHSDASIQETAKKMVDDGVSSLMVLEADGTLAGILTEKDVVTRVVASGRTETSAGSVMTPSPVVIDRAAYYYDAISLFILHGIKHLPVVENGRPAGMLTLSDLLRKKNRGAFDILQEIERADEATLPEVKHAIYGVLERLLDDAIPVLHILDVITGLYDRLIRHCVELARQKLQAQGYGVPPAAYGFFLMGSGGRREQFLLTDQDHFFVYEDPPDHRKEETAAYFRRFGEEITNLMETAGYKRCEGDMMASNAQWRGTLSQWRERIRTWGLRATNDNILLAQNFLAFRFLCGSEKLHGSFHRMVQEQFQESRIFMYRAAQLEKQAPVPVLDSPIRALFRMRKESIDMKKQALFPFYHSLQLLCVHHQMVEGTPRQQMQLLQERGIISEDAADEMLHAYETLLSIRIKQSWQQFSRGEDTSSTIHFSHLKTREKEEFITALKTVRMVQQKALLAYGLT
ncbi:DUF294 nucleotidyltransferase-like domain-containing protein [Alkalicoccus urumqiensis]|uniref:Signal transduction protein n=1 Tax=Alkalicoccus urumqiensis TaxID=1548213 RepID=A0A2P6MGG5_ALKUR|nr:DUF294 nucleotidyltransferase-like domain-containing protein [Alkalicoccus urumqiensis]PRO65361.1 hypothetical protein C6I21_09365 [Alkalicoccus urumqiensis]